MTHSNAAAPRPLVVELVGPAAVGKSAVARVLGARDPMVWARQGLGHLPRSLLVTSTIRLLPVLVSLWRDAGSVLWEESSHMVRLTALPALLQRRRLACRAVVLDQGPVFALGWLRAFGHEALHNGGRGGWWQRTVARSAQTLDLVVRLEAPDEVLIRRVRARPEPIRRNDKTDQEIAEFNARLRAGVSEVIGGLNGENGGRPLVVTLDTDERSVYEVADQLLHILGSVHAD